MGKNPSFQFSAFLRVLLLIVSAACLTAILAPPAIVLTFLDRSGTWPSFFQRAWVYAFFYLNGIPLRVEGRENLKEGGAYILTSNHASLLDIPAIVAVVPLPVRFIAKSSLIWFPIFGWFLYFAGHVLIDRDSAVSAVKSLKKASRLMKNGISVVVFPEGTRSSDGDVKEFKRGAFLLALQSRAPIVPISISGTYEMLPRTGWCLFSGTIDVKIGLPIPTEGLPIREIRHLEEKVRNIIIEQKQHAKETTTETPKI